MRPTEIIFEATEAPEGGYDARSLGYSIFTQGEDWNDLKAMVRDAVLCHFDEDNVPRVITLLVRDEGIAVPSIDGISFWSSCIRVSAQATKQMSS